MRKFMFGLATLLLCAVIALGVFGDAFVKKAEAGLYPTTVFPTFSGSVSTETTIATAAAGTHLTIHSMFVSSSVAGVVVFKDGTAGTTIANIYLAANTPTLVGQDVWGAVGYKTSSSGANITATLSTATLTILIRCDQQ